MPSFALPARGIASWPSQCCANSNGGTLSAERNLLRAACV